MQGNITPDRYVCACGCSEMMRDNECVPGHELKLYRAVVLHVGGISNLMDIIERVTGAAVEAPK